MEQKPVWVRLRLPSRRLQQALDHECRHSAGRCPRMDVCHDVRVVDLPPLVLELLDRDLLHQVREVLLQAHVDLSGDPDVGHRLGLRPQAMAHGRSGSARWRRRPRAALRHLVARPAMQAGRLQTHGAVGHGALLCGRGRLAVRLRRIRLASSCRHRGGDRSVQVQHLQIGRWRRGAFVVEAAVGEEQQPHAPTGVAEAVHARQVPPLARLRIVHCGRQGLVHIRTPPADDQQLGIEEDRGVLEPRLRRRPPLRGRLDPIPTAVAVLAETPSVLQGAVVRRPAAEDDHHPGRRAVSAHLGGVVNPRQWATGVYHRHLVPLEGLPLDVQHPDVALGLLPVVAAEDDEQGLVEDQCVAVAATRRLADHRDGHPLRMLLVPNVEQEQLLG
mmetsp:Transcript_5071/g.14429  ORF Transcript_5071/g.14429 Transcript_5071/m.14429 type:complete len:387 (-) Transcript_5071:393-1553(-)